MNQKYKKITDGILEGVSSQRIKENNNEDLVSIVRMKNFAREFREKRLKLNFTQREVGTAMGQLYGYVLSQTTISRFEALHLSMKNMSKLKPLLERWLLDTSSVYQNTKSGQTFWVSTEISRSNLPLIKKRKKRTAFDEKQKQQLIYLFNKNPKPTTENILEIAQKCNLPNNIVRVWFCNRRQKIRKISLQKKVVSDTADNKVDQNDYFQSNEHNARPSSSMQFGLLTELHSKQTYLQFMNPPITSADPRLNSEVLLPSSASATSYRELLNMEFKH